MSAILSGLASGASQIYGGAVLAKNFLYDSGFLDHCKLKTLVFSIGNLTMGGTGKTPMTIWLARQALAAGRKPCIVARGYGSRLQHPRLVDVNLKNAVDLFGDEALVMKLALPEIPVVVGNPKWQAAYWAEQNLKPDLIFVDDGFQHRTLFRNFDLVLIDASQEISDLQLVPKGRARESVASLSRADVVVLTKTNASRPELLQQYQMMLQGRQLLQAEYLLSIENLPTDGGYVLASGIGNFAALRRQVVAHLGESKVIQTIEFKDHHAYTANDAQKLLYALVSNNAQKLLVTQKDFVKLNCFPELQAYLSVLSVELRWITPPKEIYEFFNRLTV